MGTKNSERKKLERAELYATLHTVLLRYRDDLLNQAEETVTALHDPSTRQDVYDAWLVTLRKRLKVVEKQIAELSATSRL